MPKQFKGIAFTLLMLALTLPTISFSQTVQTQQPDAAAYFRQASVHFNAGRASAVVSVKLHVDRERLGGRGNSSEIKLFPTIGCSYG